MTTTPNFGWQLPQVGGNNGTWGEILNALLVNVDEDVKAQATTASTDASGRAAAMSLVFGG